MHRRDTPLWWRVKVEQWEEAPDIALWLRAAERIDATARGLVPGPLADGPVPKRTTSPSTELSVAWINWWTAIVAGGIIRTPQGTAISGEWVGMVEPEFSGLGPWPALQSPARARYPEAKAWHDARGRAGLDRLPESIPTRSLDVVGPTLERWGKRLGREAVVELLALPVTDDEIRPIREDLFMVSESLCLRADFGQRLAAFVDGLWSERFGPS
jgi:hypothetical protein